MYESAWGASFHFCRFAYGESFREAIKRHEHYLALRMGLREGMKVLDVGCGVGGPAREMVKFAGVDVVGLNNNDYQIERATRYADREGLSSKLSFVKGDFMVRGTGFLHLYLVNIVSNSLLYSKCLSHPNRLTLSTPSKPPSMHHR